MAVEVGNLISDKLFDDLSRLLRDYDRGSLTRLPPPSRGTRRDTSRPALVVALLENLEGGNTARALVLKKTARPLQMVSLRGNVSGGQFKLAYKTVNGSDPFDPAHSAPIAYDATPGEFATALERIDVINPGDVSVTLGNHVIQNADGTETELITGRWLVEFLALDAPELLVPFEESGVGDNAQLNGTPNEIITNTHNLVATAKLETVNASLPIDAPTPLMAGALAVAVWVHSIGYTIVAVECRDFSSIDPSDGY